MRLNLGCGRVRVDGFVGVDRYVAKSVDILASGLALPVRDASVDEVFASHFLEHFAGYDFERVVLEIARVLRPGGLLFARTPHREKLLTYPFHHRSVDVSTFDPWVRNPWGVESPSHLWNGVVSWHQGDELTVVLRRRAK